MPRREGPQDLLKALFLNGFDGTGDLEPLLVALVFFAPVLSLADEFQGVDGDRAGDQHAACHALVIDISAQRGAADGAFDTCFLQGLAGGAVPGLAAVHRPALGDEPTAGLARGDEQDFEFAFGAPAQRRVLHAQALFGAWMSGFRGGARHLYSPINLPSSKKSAPINPAAGMVTTQAVTMPRATFHLTAETRRDAPTPMIAPVIV